MTRKILLPAIWFSSLLAVLLNACSMPSSASGSTLLLTEPVNGASYQVGGMVQVRSQITSTDGAAQVDLLVNGEVVRSDSPSPVLYQASLLQPWMPAQAGTYTVQTQMTTTSGAKALSEQVTIQVGSFAGSTELSPGTITVTVTSPPESTITPSPTFTFTPAPPIVTAFQDANCRFGPGQVYDISGYLLSGESAPIMGRNAETIWWVIQLSSGATCWVWDGTISVSGDTSAVPVIAPPPTPTPTPYVTSLSKPVTILPSGELSCRSTVFLEWNPVVHPNGIDHYEWQVTGPGGSQNGSTKGTKVEFFVGCSSSYTWQVRAVDGNGNAGPYSDALGFQIK